VCSFIIHTVKATIKGAICTVRERIITATKQSTNYPTKCAANSGAFYSAIEAAIEASKLTAYQSALPSAFISGCWEALFSTKYSTIHAA
jgi:hypothetical protein